MPPKRILVVLLVAMLCAAAAILLDFSAPSYYRQIESGLRDAIARFGRTTPANPDLLFLAIDSNSVTLDATLDLQGLFSSSSSDPGSGRALQIMANGWPWNREIYAMVLERLVRAGAKVVAFDCLFPTPAPGDDAFHVALEQFKAQAVIGSNFVSPDNVERSSRIPSSYEPPAETLIRKTAAQDERVGFTNFFADENKVVRGAQYRVAFGERENSVATYLSLSARVVAKAGRAELIPNDLAEHLIRFTGPPRTSFRPRPLFEIFVPEYWEHNYRSGELIRDKIVIVGAAGKWQKDELLTPFGPMPGAEVHLNALNALLHTELIGDLSPFARAVATILTAILGCALWLSIRSPWLRLLALAGIDAATPFFAVWFYNHQNLYLPFLAPLLALNSTVFFCLASDFAFERIEKARLQSTLQTRDDLTHMIIHDLRAPLNLVTGYVDILEQMASDKLNPDEAECVTGAKQGADNMSDMISTLLDVGRLEAGKMPLRFQDHDLGEIARKAADQFTPVLRGRTLRCQIPPEPVVVTCDADVIRRILENLVSNALKFTQSDGTVLINVERTGADVIISVSDNGEGIPRDEHEHIFEKFGQTNSGRQHRYSTGLGLAFCRLAVEAHKGKIGVQSEPGKGSTFWFTLPTRDQSGVNNTGNSQSAHFERIG
ncbi:MAG TPA: CHASE2 domain-containing protein [Chthoniobacterales bacterium]|nr:CHASE2 domain-containing protein [Chthoniobacterales bacterium]